MADSYRAAVTIALCVGCAQIGEPHKAKSLFTLPPAGAVLVAQPPLIAVKISRAFDETIATELFADATLTSNTGASIPVSFENRWVGNNNGLTNFDIIVAAPDLEGVKWARLSIKPPDWAECPSFVQPNGRCETTLSVGKSLRVSKVVGCPSGRVVVELTEPVVFPNDAVTLGVTGGASCVFVANESHSTGLAYSCGSNATNTSLSLSIDDALVDATGTIEFETTAGGSSLDVTLDPAEAFDHDGACVFWVP